MALTPDEIKARLELFEEHLELIKTISLGVHPEHGKEPPPFIVNDGHFVNDDWCTWYKLIVPGCSYHRIIEDCAKRTTQILFPTPESREGLFAKVSNNKEIMFFRTLTTRIHFNHGKSTDPNTTRS